ncbi:MAG: DNA recombination/repair protein RecA [Acidobacteriota bacterium]|nr:DNA recombination/repair protein RecA [Acidobacteriota bacterium]
MAKPKNAKAPKKKGRGKTVVAVSAKDTGKATKIPSARDYLAQLKGMDGVVEGDFTFFGEELGSSGRAVTEWIPTGILALDRLTGGGWPVGRITEVCSWEGVGKTTLLDHSIAQAQMMGGIAGLIDSEFGRDPGYTKRLGVRSDELILVEAKSMDEGFEQLDRIIAVQESYLLRAKDPRKVPPMLLIWDSLGGTATRNELDNKATVGEHARMISLNFRRYTQRIAHARIALVFSNHFYKQIGGYGSLVSFGGKGIRYYSSLRVWLTKTEELKLGSGANERVVGHIVEAKLKKTRVSRPKEPTGLGLIYGAGFHNAYSLFDWGKTAERYPGIPWVKQAGSVYYLSTGPAGEVESFSQQYIGLGELFRAQPEIYQTMAHAYLDSDPVT